VGPATAISSPGATQVTGDGEREGVGMGVCPWPGRSMGAEAVGPLLERLVAAAPAAPLWSTALLPGILDALAAALRHRPVAHRGAVIANWRPRPSLPSPYLFLYRSRSPVCRFHASTPSSPGFFFFC